MKLIARYTLLLTIFSSSLSLCFAQSGNPPPPPAPAIEYNMAAWQEVSPAGGGFTISMPGSPTFSIDKVEDDGAMVSNHLYSLSTKTAEYIVSYADFPVVPDNTDAARTILDSSRDYVLAETKGARLLSENDIELDGQVGRELLVQKGNVIIRVRVFFIKGRFYQIGIGTPLNVAFKSGQPSAKPEDRTDFYEATATKFLDSFKLTNAQAALGEVDNYLAKEKVMGRATNNSTGSIIKGGVLDGRAISLPQPVYPPIARAARASGKVTVKVIVDEEGKVVAVQAESGHPLLQQAAVKAAREARFSPTMLEGKPVKVVGVISYSFVLK